MISMAMGPSASCIWIRPSRSLTLWLGLRNVVVGLAQRAACTARRQPRVQTARVECVTAGETTDIIVVLQGIDTDGAGVSGMLEHLRWDGSLDLLVFIIHFMFVCRVVRLGWSQFVILVGFIFSCFGGGSGRHGRLCCRLLFLSTRFRIRTGLFHRYLCGGREWTLCLLRLSSNRAFCITQTGRPACRWSSNATFGRQTLFCSGRCPGFVFGQWEPFIDFIHRHQLLFPSSPTRARDGDHVDWIAIFILLLSSIALVVAKTVFHTDNDPVNLVSKWATFWVMAIGLYQRLVNTTPKPRATKKRRGELVGP